MFHLQLQQLDLNVCKMANFFLMFYSDYGNEAVIKNLENTNVRFKKGNWKLPMI